MKSCIVVQIKSIKIPLQAIDMEYFVQKITETYNWLSDYYWSQQKIEDHNNLSSQEKIVALRKLLKQKCSYSQYAQGKIQMQFAKTLQCPEYRKFSFTTQMPSQHNVPKKAPQKQLICIYGQVIVKSDTIKCPLLIQVLFDQISLQSLPKIYVKCPNLPFEASGQKLLRTSKPYGKFVQIVKNKKFTAETKKFNYRSSTDGIQILLPKRQIDWKFNLKSLLDQCVELIKRQFPFVKMKQPVVLVDQQENIDSQTQKIYNLSKKLKNSLEIIEKDSEQPKLLKNGFIQNKNEKSQLSHPTQFLRVVQELDLLEKFIRSSDLQLKFKNIQLLKAEKQMEKDVLILQQKSDLSEFFPAIQSSDPLQKQLFEIMVQHEATKDCVVEVEKYLKNHRKIQKKHLDRQDFKKAMLFFEQLNEKVFLQRFKISLLIKKIQTKQLQALK